MPASVNWMLTELSRLDHESEQFFTQGLLSHAAQSAKEYGRLRRKLEREGIECPPSVSLWRCA